MSVLSGKESDRILSKSAAENPKIPSDQQSFSSWEKISQSDPTGSDQIRTLQEEIKKKRKETLDARRRHVLASIQIENEKLKAGLLEKELEKLRLEVRKKEKEKEQQSSSQEIEALEKTLENKTNETKNLRAKLEEVLKEKKRFNENIKEMWEEYQKLKKNGEATRVSLEQQRGNLLEKLNVREISSADSLTPLLQQKEILMNDIASVRQEVDNFYQLIHEKNEIIQSLKTQIEETILENETISEVITLSHNQAMPADPPADHFMPIIEVYPQNGNQRQLLSDIGSTESINAKIQEESKESHYASPDPFENLLHLSTGETVQEIQRYEQGAATPPEVHWEMDGADTDRINNYDELEEVKEPVTPKNRGLGRSSSESSTPKGQESSLRAQFGSYEHEEEPIEQAFQGQRGSGNRKFDSVPKSLFD